MPKALFVSDLHLFSRRSIGQKHWNECLPVIEQVEHVVLGGDLFDYRWSQLGDLHATLPAVREWLRNCLVAYPQKSWHYILGNHDCHPEHQNLLRELGDTHQNLQWYEEQLTLASCLFLHGDLLDASVHPDGLEVYRRHFHEVRPRSELASRTYDWLVGCRVHTVVARLRHRSKRTCRQLIRRIRSKSNGLGAQTQSIVFGHTHVPIHGLLVDGYRFYNPGSGIRNTPFRPIVLEIEAG